MSLSLEDLTANARMWVASYTEHKAHVMMGINV